MTSQGFVYSEISAGVATLEFGHPKANSLPLELLERLALEIEKLSNTTEVRVIILRSEGEVFCSGASFDELLQIKSIDEGERFFSGFAKVLVALAKCKKMVVGRTIGKAVGGGVGILAGCDYVMATEKASIRLSELSIGLGAFVIAPALERKIGKTAFAQLSLGCRWENAYWAERKGLYSQVFETPEELDKELDFFTHTISTYNPEALAQLKEMCWKDAQNWEHQLFENAKITGKLVVSNYTKQQLLKFKNK